MESTTQLNSFSHPTQRKHILDTYCCNQQEEQEGDYKFLFLPLRVKTHGQPLYFVIVTQMSTGRTAKAIDIFNKLKKTARDKLDRSKQKQSRKTAQEDEERMVLLIIGDVEQFKKDFKTTYFYQSDAMSPEGYYFVHANIKKSQMSKLRRDKNVKKYQLAGSVDTL